MNNFLEKLGMSYDNRFNFFFQTSHFGDQLITFASAEILGPALNKTDQGILLLC
jgi:hypothetical protein